MTLIDKDIRALIQMGVLRNADETRVGSVAYDLRAAYYTQPDGTHADALQLAPVGSVFVACEERIDLPGDLIGRVALRNGSIRAGLTLDAPVYQPGHKTRVFFRITNMSGKPVQLEKGAGLASIMFERLERTPAQVYGGRFQNEFDL